MSNTNPDGKSIIRGNFEKGETRESCKHLGKASLGMGPDGAKALRLDFQGTVRTYSWDEEHERILEDETESLYGVRSHRTSEAIVTSGSH